MADTVTGASDCQLSNFFATPLFADREDLAYLQGSRAIESLRLGHLGTRQLIRQFKDALSIRGLSDPDVDIQVAQFWVYYWTMNICLTVGAERRTARKQAKRYKQSVDRLRLQIGRPVLFT